MLEALRFVRGAIAQKNHVPVLQHFRIHDGRVQAYNGVVSLNAPIECDLSIKPQAATFVHAITLCDEVVALHETKTGRLAVTSGKFSAYIDTSVEEFPDIVPKGEVTEATAILDALKALAPFMSDDASRPWSRGVLFVGNSAFATNNVILVEHWIKQPVVKPFGLPAMAVNELLRIGEEPARLQISDNSVTFHFDGGRWLTTSLLIINQWPDVRRLFLDKNDAVTYPLGETFFEALEKLRPFTKDLRPVWLAGDTISTASGEHEGAHLATTGCEGLNGKWALDQLLRLKGAAECVGWDAYPKPCPFFGGVLRGVIIGMLDED